MNSSILLSYRINEFADEVALMNVFLQTRYQRAHPSVGVCVIGLEGGGSLRSPAATL